MRHLALAEGAFDDESHHAPSERRRYEESGEKRQEDEKWGRPRGGDSRVVRTSRALFADLLPVIAAIASGSIGVSAWAACRPSATIAALRLCVSRVAGACRATTRVAAVPGAHSECIRIAACTPWPRSQAAAAVAANGNGSRIIAAACPEFVAIGAICWPPSDCPRRSAVSRAAGPVGTVAAPGIGVAPSSGLCPLDGRGRKRRAWTSFGNGITAGSSLISWRAISSGSKRIATRQRGG